MADRCDFSDLLVTDCSHCRGMDVPEPVFERYSFVARFDGVCRICSMDIVSGDRLTVVVEGSPAIHQECA